MRSLIKLNISLLVLFCTSCASFDRTYIEYGSTVYSVIVGNNHPTQTQAEYNGNSYSYAMFQFGRQESAKFVLAYVNNGIYTWVGADMTKIHTDKYGKIVKTEGLDHDMELLNYDKKEKYAYVNLYDPDLLQIEYFFNSTQPKNIERTHLENKIISKFEKEKIKVEQIYWSKVNKYYFYNNRPIYSEQYIHPKLPILKISFYFK